MATFYHVTIMHCLRGIAYHGLLVREMLEARKGWVRYPKYTRLGSVYLANSLDVCWRWSQGAWSSDSNFKLGMDIRFVTLAVDLTDEEASKMFFDRNFGSSYGYFEYPGCIPYDRISVIYNGERIPIRQFLRLLIKKEIQVA